MAPDCSTTWSAGSAASAAAMANDDGSPSVVMRRPAVSGSPGWVVMSRTIVLAFSVRVSMARLPLVESCLGPLHRVRLGRLVQGRVDPGRVGARAWSASARRHVTGCGAMSPAGRPSPRQDGRRFVVTGANSGVGLETARALAAAGAHVVAGLPQRRQGRGAARDIRRRRRAAACRGATRSTSPTCRRCGRSRTGVGDGRRARQQRRHPRGAVRAAAPTASSCSWPPTTSATSRWPTCCCRG